MNAKIKMLVGVILLLVLSSCATVVSGDSKDIIVNTDPSGATVSVMKPSFDMVDVFVTSNKTPTVLHLKRGNGAFRPAQYLLMFEKDGYMTDTIELNAGLNGIYLGNLIIGGPLGLLIDPITGAAWNLPDRIDYTLRPLK